MKSNFGSRLCPFDSSSSCCLCHWKSNSGAKSNSKMSSYYLSRLLTGFVECQATVVVEGALCVGMLFCSYRQFRIFLRYMTKLK